MRTHWPLALRNEIASDAPDVVLLARLDRKDGVAMGFTSSDVPVSVLGLAYLPDEGVTLSASQMGIGGEVDTVEATGAFLVSRISQDDVRTRALSGAILTLMLCPRSAPSAIGILQRYEVASVKSAGGAFRIEGRGATARTRQENGDVIAKTCPCRNVGDARCKASLTGLLRGYSRQETLPARVGCTDRTLLLTGGAQIAEFYTFGTVLVGNVRREVRASSFAGGVTTITLREPLPEAPAATTSVLVTAGCNRKLLYEKPEAEEPRLGNTCTEWENGVNFRGFWDLPGTNAAFDVADKGKA